LPDKKDGHRLRYAGILAHISSLPSPYGIGDIGKSAYDFLDFLERAGQLCWQFLPLGPVVPAFGFSPYMSSSSFAGNPLLISPEMLYEQGLLSRKDIDGSLLAFSEYLVDFVEVSRWKDEILRRAFKNFTDKNDNIKRLEEYVEQEPWIKEYALFAALKEHYGGKPWNVWPADLALFSHSAINAASRKFEEQVRFHVFVQFVFDSQWNGLKQVAESKGIRLFGDMPIYVAFDSADVWANQENFHLESKTRLPVAVAGVPPDYFSATGQLWGNPLYRWKIGGRINVSLYDWWKRRFKRQASMVHMLRIDHFRGFEAYWSIPASERNAINGKWIKGPGKSFFDRVIDKEIELEIVAEDLGTITQEVEKLRKKLGFPGMKILQFAFDSDNTNPYLPHNFEDINCVVYTGTHDNDTILGWYLDPSSGTGNKEKALRYANSDGSAIHRDFIRMAYASVAKLAVIPLQDVLGFGSDCRMNVPSKPDNNCRWRCAPRFLTDEIASYLKDEASFYNRC
jgi:4-alpha-glucanotransferase